MSSKYEMRSQWQTNFVNFQKARIAMNDAHHRLRRQALPALLWGSLIFAAIQFVVGRYLHRRHPEFFDPEVTLRLEKLPKRLAEAPERPLALALGSSRFVMGLRPQSVMEQAEDVPNVPILFNFSMLGGGPVAQRMTLHRIIEKGIHPQWLFVEIWPPLLPQRYPLIEEYAMFRRDRYWADVSILRRLYNRGGEAVGQLIAQTLTPLLGYREPILTHYAPSLLPSLLREMNDRGFEKYVQFHLDEFGWVENDDKPDPALLNKVRKLIKPLLLGNFAVDGRSDRALRDLLEECRTYDIQVMLMLMPDHSLIRGWYPMMQDRLLPYLRQLSSENRVPILDARAWQSDEDFPDGIHLSPKAARAFSERFGREIYRPLIQGQKPRKECFLCGFEQP
jgi:hypothetical protein